MTATVIINWLAEGDLMQDPEHQLAKCPKCHAAKRQPCTTRYGTIAEKVHYGRPYWSSVAKNYRPAKIQGDNVEIEINLEEFKIIADLRRPNICTDCGDPYNAPALIKRCASRHVT